MSVPDPAAPEVRRVRVAFVAGLVLAAGVVGALALGPPPVRFSGTAVGFGCSAPCYLPFIPQSVQQFPRGVLVDFHWGDTNGTLGAIVFEVIGPSGGVVNGTGASGSEAFISTGGTYEFSVHSADHQVGYLYASYSGTG